MPLLQRASQDSRSAENAVLNEIEKEDVKLNFVYLEQSHDGMQHVTAQGACEVRMRNALHVNLPFGRGNMHIHSMHDIHTVIVRYTNFNLPSN